MKLLYIHGMNESCTDPATLLADWNTKLFGKPDVPNADFAFWADLSVMRQPRDLSLMDDVMVELYKLGTNNHFLGDCYNYFYDAAIKEQINQRLIDKLTPEPTVLLSHSLGTVISYDVLKNFSKYKNFTPDIQLYLTVGSPLGLEPVLAELRKENGSNGLPAPAGVRAWQNINDPLDPVALVHGISTFYSGIQITDCLVHNPMSPQSPHSIDGYLTTATIKNAVAAAGFSAS
jgi:hypothetical protein